MIKNLNGFAIIVVVALLVVLGAVGFVKAIDGSPTYIIENIEQANFSMEEASLGDFEDGMNLGASGTRFPNGISADSTSPIAGEVRGATLTLTSSVAMTGKLNLGGDITNASTTLTSARALTAAEVCDSSIITVNSAAVAATVSAASLDITLPSTTTLFALCLASEGDHVSFLFANNSPTAASTTQIVAGTGIDLLEVADGDASNVEIGGLSAARIDIYRHTGLEAGTLDAYATVSEFSPAD